MKALLVDYVVIGGGNAKRLGRLSQGLRLGHNQAAFRGGFRLWAIDDVRELKSRMHHHESRRSEWRML